MVSAAVAHLTAAVRLLLLEALFMQISGVSSALTWPHRLYLLWLLLCWVRWHCTWFLRPECLFTSPMGSGSSPLSCGVFLPPPLSQAFLLLIAGYMPPLLPESLQPTWLVYLQFQERFPSPNVWCSVRPTLFPMCLYCSYWLLFSFSFSPGWRLVCPGG
jgi:hypothetical protein